MNEMRILSCDAPYNQGGLGKFFAHLIEACRRRGELDTYYTSIRKPNDPQGTEISLEKFRWLFQISPLRNSLGWTDFLSADLFDRAVARVLGKAETFHGFSGRARNCFARACQLKYQQLDLEAPTSHIDHILRQHDKAISARPIEKSWLNGRQHKKSISEYEMADVIYVPSEYSRQTYLDAGVPAAKLRRRFFSVEPRFAPPSVPFSSSVFCVVYVGRLHVTKGLAVLIEAFAQIHDRNAELILVGGCATDGMATYLRRKMASDSRIKIRPGDPLPYLHRADVLVHPSFEDGLGLAPLEALACGVPVLVTEDTGMKEYVVNGRNGYILSTGDVDALVEQLRAIKSRPLKGKFEAFSLLSDDGTTPEKIH